MLTFNHFNFNVLDLDRSIDFYARALGLSEVKRTLAEDGSFIIVFLGDGTTQFRLELTWLRDRKEPFKLGDLEYHLCMQAEDFQAAHEQHAQMGVICYENPAMGVYFIQDPDGYWIEIMK